ncbi:MAG TPA: L,D-transpeptidase family protein [Roseiarcus sp.]|nr:L,D-transpeptidase family protein [Roseiarcus sp.]
MKKGGWPAGLASLCALALASHAGLVAGARAEEQSAARAASAVIEPELPPDAGGPPAIAGSSDAAPRPALRQGGESADEPASAQAAAPPQSAAQPEDATKTDPEAVFAGETIIEGARPRDIAAALAALPVAEGKKSPVAGLPNWAAARDALERFYLARGDMPIFTDARGFSAAGRAAIGRIRRADEDGLDLSSFAIPDAHAAIDNPADLAAAEIGLAEAIIAYSFQASGGRINPTRISPLITARPAIADPEAALEIVAAAEDKDAALAAFNPPQKGYRELRERLAALRAAYPAAAANLYRRAPKPEGNGRGAALIRPNFEIGGRQAKAERRDRGAQIAAADAPQPDALADDRLDPTMAQAIARRGPRAIEAAILANMEMWRWEPREMGEERIEINVPDFRLRLVKGDETLHSARVIVGKPETQTPIFSNVVRYIQINPAWSVPPSIIRKEMLPKLADDPDYLARMGYEVTKHGDTIRVTQPPGEKNALGRIAFMFPNEHSVYLHDTPARSLFGASRRAFSHGCVRVEQPIKLAELVMGGAWSEQRFRALIGGAERTVFLPHPLPIHIEYFTAFVGEDGDLQLREDLYGHTRRVESALGLDS